MKLLLLLLGCPTPTADTDTAAPVCQSDTEGLPVTEDAQISSTDCGADRWFANEVVIVGDIDADGFDDVVAACKNYDGALPDQGAAYVFFGSAAGLRASDLQRVTGSATTSTDFFGHEVAAAGDVDGDGHADLLVGADEDYYGTGAAYLFYGGPTGVDTSRELRFLASDGGPSATFGAALGAVGDVDGDGVDDVAIGAIADDEEDADAGAVYLYSGSASGMDVDSEHKLTAVDATRGHHLGASVAGKSDVDGDGYKDVLAGAPGDRDVDYHAGAVYVFLGGATGPAFVHDVKVYAADGADSDGFGVPLAGGGDLDGDGFDDVVAGATGVDDPTASGAAYVFFGGTGGLDTSGQQRLRASSPEEGAYFGAGLSFAGDRDGDGFLEILVGSPGADGDVGTAYVYGGSESGPRSDRVVELAPSDGAFWDGFGRSLTGGGDLDGDGCPDTVIGSRDHDGTGAMYVYYGAGP